jgi:hypothetical protein
VLVCTGDVESAREQYWILLEQHPLDYAAGFLLLQSELLLMMRAQDAQESTDIEQALLDKDLSTMTQVQPRTLNAMKALDKAFAAVGSQLRTSNYTGFDPSPTLTSLLTGTISTSGTNLRSVALVMCLMLV